MAQSTPYFLKPGLHSYNIARKAKPQQSATRRTSKIRLLLVIVGVLCLGYFGFSFADREIYQVYENWAFDQQIKGQRGVTFRDFVREQTPFGFVAGKPAAATTVVFQKPSLGRPAITNGSIIGRVAINRLGVSAIVRQGVDDQTLRVAVGHVPSTAFAGEVGNFAIAAHRDTLFRALKDVRRGDVVTFQAPDGLFNYEVMATKIVSPSDISVLQADGGGLIPSASGAESKKLLTMITCYPFYYVGSAPKRFIVEARLWNDNGNR